MFILSVNCLSLNQKYLLSDLYISFNIIFNVLVFFKYSMRVVLIVNKRIFNMRLILVDFLIQLFGILNIMIGEFF